MHATGDGLCVLWTGRPDTVQDTVHKCGLTLLLRLTDQFGQCDERKGAISRLLAAAFHYWSVCKLDLH